jgi:hypothetical protein
MTDNTIKFCKDCKHGKRDWLYGWQFAKCKAFPISDVDLVSGKKTTVYEETFCENQRRVSFRCGPHAKLFEEKEKKVWWMK